MEYIDIHAHMVSRSTDEYRKMALTGCKAVTEPSFWAGYDRLSAEAFADYYHLLTGFEPERAARYGIAHYTWLSLNPKEGEDRSLARKVLEIIPMYLDRPNVLGIGEIGLNRVTRNELATFVDQVDLAVRYSQSISIHTPHMEDKYKGTRVILDALSADGRLEPERVLVDHAEEHTIGMILDRGYWAGITLYPITKTSPGRAVDMIEVYGSERICVASACDWADSDPIAVARFIQEMRRRGHAEERIRKIVYENPVKLLSRSPHFGAVSHRAEAAF
jgi:predicted metal-dependent TIM-barrel fold hydrolase